MSDDDIEKLSKGLVETDRAGVEDFIATSLAAMSGVEVGAILLEALNTAISERDTALGEVSGLRERVDGLEDDLVEVALRLAAAVPAGDGERTVKAEDAYEMVAALVADRDGLRAVVEAVRGTLGVIRDEFDQWVVKVSADHEAAPSAYAQRAAVRRVLSRVEDQLGVDAKEGT